MKYNELRIYFEYFHLGQISKIELAMAIGLWQRGGAII
jgi:hypothetical protein